MQTSSCKANSLIISIKPEWFLPTISTMKEEIFTSNATLIDMCCVDLKDKNITYYQYFSYTTNTAITLVLTVKKLESINKLYKNSI
jgi:NADH:ubiquinone oxidoreductase subunit C